MSKPFFEWRQNSPGELAQYVQTSLPTPLRWPTSINQLDVLATAGPRGVVQQLYEQLIAAAIDYDPAPFDAQAEVLPQIRKPQTILDGAQATCLDLVALLAGMCLSS